MILMEPPRKMFTIFRNGVEFFCPTTSALTIELLSRKLIIMTKPNANEANIENQIMCLKGKNNFWNGVYGVPFGIARGMLM